MPRWPLTLLVIPSVALAGNAPVIGGGGVDQGDWPDTAAVMYSNGGQLVQECSGTLIAPTVVITAGHCDPTVTAGIGDLRSVLLGTSSLARPDDGESIKIARIVTYPASQSSMDVAILVLAHDARTAPRPIATGWARFDIVDGADVKLVGFGAVDKNGNRYIDDLQQAETQITDADC